MGAASSLPLRIDRYGQRWLELHLLQQGQQLSEEDLTAVREEGEALESGDASRSRLEGTSLLL